MVKEQNPNREKAVQISMGGESEAHAAKGSSRISQLNGKRRMNMIVKVKDGYQVLSTKGKNLGGPYKTLEEAEKRLREVEYFKHQKG
jgi:hypothetical protein